MQLVKVLSRLMRPFHELQRFWDGCYLRSSVAAPHVHGLLSYSFEEYGVIRLFFKT
jgi:hypothetical protein